MQILIHATATKRNQLPFRFFVCPWRPDASLMPLQTISLSDQIRLAWKSIFIISTNQSQNYYTATTECCRTSFTASLCFCVKCTGLVLMWLSTGLSTGWVSNRQYGAGSTVQAVRCRQYGAGSTVQAVRCRQYGAGSTVQAVICWCSYGKYV